MKWMKTFLMLPFNEIRPNLTVPLVISLSWLTSSIRIWVFSLDDSFRTITYKYYLIKILTP